MVWLILDILRALLPPPVGMAQSYQHEFQLHHQLKNWPMPSLRDGQESLRAAAGNSGVQLLYPPALKNVIDGVHEQLWTCFHVLELRPAPVWLAARRRRHDYIPLALRRGWGTSSARLMFRGRCTVARSRGS